VIVLTPTRLHWLGDVADDPFDLCAHSPVDFRIADTILVRPEDGDWAVSAAALYLLRTLERDHTREKPVGSQFFPCCGHAMFQVPNLSEVVIIGCAHGADFEVRHSGSDVLVSTPTGSTLAVLGSEWRKAVFNFADSVRAFYDRCLPKESGEPEDEAAFSLFWQEWSRRRSS
jgi:hypothetical protein